MNRLLILAFVSCLVWNTSSGLLPELERYYLRVATCRDVEAKNSPVFYLPTGKINTVSREVGMATFWRGTPGIPGLSGKTWTLMEPQEHDKPTPMMALIEKKECQEGPLRWFQKQPVHVKVSKVLPSKLVKSCLPYYLDAISHVTLISDAPEINPNKFCKRCIYVCREVGAVISPKTKMSSSYSSLMHNVELRLLEQVPDLRLGRKPESWSFWGMTFVRISPCVELNDQKTGCHKYATRSIFYPAFDECVGRFKITNNANPWSFSQTFTIEMCDKELRIPIKGTAVEIERDKFYPEIKEMNIRNGASVDWHLEHPAFEGGRFPWECEKREVLGSREVLVGEFQPLDPEKYSGKNLQKDSKLCVNCAYECWIKK